MEYRSFKATNKFVKLKGVRGDYEKGVTLKVDKNGIPVDFDSRQALKNHELVEISKKKGVNNASELNK